MISLLLAALTSSASCVAPSGTAALIEKAMPLFENGKSVWVVSVPEGASRPIRYAAEELTNTIAKISGARLSVMAEPQVFGKNVIRLVCTGNEMVDEFFVKTEPGEVILTGNSPRATLFAAYQFLKDHLDARWYWPGESGEFLPRLEKFEVKKSARTVRPYFPSREMSICSVRKHRHADTERWFARVGFNFGCHTPTVQEDVGFLKRYSGHRITLPIRMKEREALFAEHPEWFSLLGGERALKGIAGCWSNEEYFGYLVTNLTAEIRARKPDLANIFVADIIPRCECEGCTANPDKSARYWNYYARLIEEIRKEFPDLHFAGIAYQEYRKIPGVKVKYLDYVEYCQYNRCYYHALGDKNCTLNAKSMDEFARWADQAPLGLYGYEFDVFDRAMYLPMWNVFADEMKTFKKMGLRRMKTELPVGLQRLTDKKNPLPPDQILQLASRLSVYAWAAFAVDPDLEPEALVDDFCRHVYGPASEDMKAYHAIMANAWDHMKVHVTYFGSSPRNHADRLLSAEVQAQATRHLEAATRAAKGNPRVVAEVELDAAAFANWVTLAEEARRGGTTHDLKLIREEDAFNTVGWLKAMAKKGKPQMTRFKLYRGTKALHLLAECEEKENPAFDRGTTKNDAHNWGSPSIEIFLDAGDGGSRQIAFSPAGGVWDAKDGDVSWNSGATVRTTFEADKWLLEAEIPYEGIGVNPTSGDRWKIMIIRNPGGGSKFSGAGWPVNAHRDYGSAATLVFK